VHRPIAVELHQVKVRSIRLRNTFDELAAQREEVLNIPLGQICILGDRPEFGDLLNNSRAPSLAGAAIDGRRFSAAETTLVRVGVLAMSCHAVAVAPSSRRPIHADPVPACRALGVSSRGSGLSAVSDAPQPSPPLIAAQVGSGFSD
jgi:hypothetical protein